MTDTRNVLDEFKGKGHDEIVAVLDARGVTLGIASFELLVAILR